MTRDKFYNEQFKIMEMLSGLFGRMVWNSTQPSVPSLMIEQTDGDYFYQASDPVAEFRYREAGHGITCFQYGVVHEGWHFSWLPVDHPDVNAVLFAFVGNDYIWQNQIAIESNWLKQRRAII